ncbi:FkbM family methyltransferase [Rhizobium sp. CNPSo 4062]|uniref:FkbM family methyltransferase n=1 Tax=Rhizobium sp. CNPSo 4062 TaxID=3021410 RepID=UPI00254CC021|nr:FkbM family methyltransferase [Rhizobium sp. CNPSo 4062]MDK4705017.1 FkbM family methyltransferase [Rhizobium sp. CNPSo 4062]
MGDQTETETSFDFRGKFFYVHHDNPQDHIFLQLQQRREFYERELLDALASYLSPGDFVLDVGANIGNHTIYFAGVSKCFVAAFEPNPRVVNILRRNIAANDLTSRVEVHDIGLSDHRGVGQMVEGDFANNLGAYKLQEIVGTGIGFCPLDDIKLPHRPRLIKIDVEGMELQVLRGAKKTISDASPIISLECSNGNELSLIDQYLSDLGYSCIDAFNYTPTHVFVRTNVDDYPRQNLRAASHALSKIELTRFVVDEHGHRLMARIRKDSADAAAGFGKVIVAIESVKSAIASLNASVAGQFAGIIADNNGLTAIERELVELRGELLNGEAAQIMQGRIAEIASVLHQLESQVALLQRDLTDDKVIVAIESVNSVIASLKASMADTVAEQSAGIIAGNNVLAAIERELVELRGELLNGEAAQIVQGRRIAEAASEIEALRAETKDMAAMSGDALIKLTDTLHAVDRRIADVRGDLVSGFRDQRAEVSSLKSSIANTIKSVTKTNAKELGLVLLRESERKQHEILEDFRQKNRMLERRLRLIEGGVRSVYLHSVEDVSEAPSSICVSIFNFASGWGDWRHQQSVKLEPAGWIELRQDRSTPGVGSPIIRTEVAGLYQVRVKAFFEAPTAGPRPFVRVVDAATSEILGPDTPLSGEETLFRFYQPHRVSDLKISILVAAPRIGYRLQVVSVQLDRVGGNSHQKWVSRKIGHKVIASMASIPSRTPMLRDAVQSLLVQCDEVRVFLNGYPNIPDFLDHPRVKVRRSETWDDTGDAGKFGWIEEDDEPGYRIICDDDLLFPPDLVERLVGEVQSTQDEAFVGLHGIILRQPIRNYYASGDRHAVHFHSALADTKAVHVLATCVMCYHSTKLSMSRADFMYRNMADIWLAKHARDRNIPLLIINRPFKWVRQNSQKGGFETIYDNALKKTKNFFDSSRIQDAVVKQMQPVSLKAFGKPAVLVAVTVSTKENLEAFLNSFYDHRPNGKEWLIVLILRHQQQEMQAFVRTMPFHNELHILNTSGKSRDGAGTAFIRLASKLNFDIGFLTHDCVRFADSDWCEAALDNVTEAQSSATFDIIGDTLVARRNGSLGDLSVFSKRALFELGLKNGSNDVSLFGQYGLRLKAFIKPYAAASNESHQLGRLMAGGISKVASTKNRTIPLFAPKVASRAKGGQVNDVFERVVVINLERRPDRWTSVNRQLNLAGIKAERFRAVDGKWPEVLAEYREYVAKPLRWAAANEVGSLTSEFDFYVNAKTESQRVMWLEQKQRRKAIASAGAWAYLKTLIAILGRAIDDGVESLLVFDDDVIFHKNFQSIFASAADELPDDWLLLNLGTLQYHWNRKWMRWHSQHLYRSLGSAIGSHAVGMKAEILPFLLERAERMEMPYDIGPLSAATRSFSGRSFVIYPNIAIQGMSPSDINSSSFQNGNDKESILDTYRWKLSDYHYDRR